ncbi:hypothetical protein WN944_014114 [Citrus x changshan-huyou]|uniref:HMA domain-containing protein n=1 Tax=Citrus x changshan-huyou TaxID=2935761 RepID=A0AAP0M7T6_9ROSI|nr:hypothetical protein CUMW_149250 [Citrus unshiu]GAY53440.1 hypothetical protein CUMW_149250 [Citrus unshiu]
MASLSQEVILAADLRCDKCQDRIANAISRVNDVESMEVLVSEKKVILTYKSASEESSGKAAVGVKNNQSNKAVKGTAWFPSYS